MSDAITAAPPLPPVTDERPTHVRYWVVGLATLMAVLLYLDRFCLSFTLTYIQEDLGLSERETGWLLSAFFWTYALAQVPSGWLSDRYGPRLMLALYILLWSVFTGWVGLVGSFFFLLLLRFGVGVAQAGAYPTSANLVSKWVPFTRRGLASAVISTGGRIGGFAAPLLTAYLMVAFVPLEVPSLLNAGDILNADALCQRLADSGDTPKARLARSIREQLPAPAADLVRECAAGLPQGKPLAERASLLAEGLNEVLKRPGLFRSVNREEFELPREARTLADIPDGELTAAQVERRNRLLLEAAFPKEIRKIYGTGWRPVMLVYGGIGLVVALLFWRVVRDRPQEHPRCNAGELAAIEEGGPPTAVSPHGKVRALPMAAILRSRSLWLSSISQFATNFGWVFIGLLFPRYLTEVHAVPIEERGWMSSLPLLIGLLGMLVGGWLTDRLAQLLGVRWGRRLPMSLTRFMAMGGFVACLLLDSPWPVTVALCVVAVSVDLGTASVWAFMQDVGGKHVGSILGWGNMWGNVGAAVSSPVLTWIIKPQPDSQPRWDLCFLVCAVAFLVSGVAAIGIDATIPVAPREDESAEKQSE